MSLREIGLFLVVFLAFAAEILRTKAGGYIGEYSKMQHSRET